MPKRKAIPLPIFEEPSRCIARNRVCRNPNGCEYRFKRGDKSNFCPVCNYERRCKNYAVTGTTVCRMHGARKGMISNRGKYYVAKKISEDYSRIMKSEELVSVSAEIALLGARTSELQVHIDNVDRGVAVKKIKDALDMLNMAISMQFDGGRVLRAASMLEQAMSPLVIEQAAWKEIRENVLIHQKLVDSEREWLTHNSGVITPGQFVETLSWILELCMQYIPNQDDRLRFFRAASGVLPSSAKTGVTTPLLSPARAKELVETADDEAKNVVEGEVREVDG